MVKKELSKCTDFAYLACRCGELNGEDEQFHAKTFLAKHHLTLVEEKTMEIEKVKDDQDDNAASGGCGNKSSTIKIYSGGTSQCSETYS